MRKKIQTIVYFSLVLIVALTLSQIKNSPVEAQTKSKTRSPSYSVTVPATTVTAFGCTAPYGLVTVFENNLTTGSVVATGAGQFSKTLSIDSLGIHNIKVYSEDSRGYRTSTMSQNISVSAQVDTLKRFVLPSTIEINASVFAQGEPIAFIGTTCPDTDLKLRIDNNIELDLRSNERGEWYAQLSSAGFFLGEHSYYVSRYDTAGSVYSQKQLFRVIESSAGKDREQSNELLPPKITSPDDNYLSSSPKVTIIGTAQPNTQIELIVDGRITGSIFSNPLGEWRFELFMNKRQISVEARACRGKNCTQPSNEVTIFYPSAVDTCQIGFNLADYRFFRHTVNHGINLQLSIASAEPPVDLLIDWGDDAVERTTLAQNKSASYHHVYNFVGLYNGIVSFEDANGCTQTQYFSVEVIYSNSNYWWTMAVAVSIVSVVDVVRTHQKERELQEKMRQMRVERPKRERLLARRWRSR